MSLVSQHLSNTTNSSLVSLEHAGDHDHQHDDHDDYSAHHHHLFTEAALSKLLGVAAHSSRHSMDRSATAYSQSGLHSPSSALADTTSEDSPADHASAAQYPSQQEVRPSNYSHSSSATPTSEYGVYPTSARSASFPDHLARPYHPSSSHGGSNGGVMAQSTSPSLPLQDDRTSHENTQIKSDQDVPIDPSIAATSPTYPPHNGQYSPYPQQQEMQHGYPNHPSAGAMYAQPRPDWAGYAGGQHPMHGGYPVSGAQTPTAAAPSGARPGQVGHHLLQFISPPPSARPLGSRGGGGGAVHAVRRDGARPSLPWWSSTTFSMDLARHLPPSSPRIAMLPRHPHACS